jgi:hypothetical protein
MRTSSSAQRATVPFVQSVLRGSLAIPLGGAILSRGVMPQLTSGTVTFLVIDVDGSTATRRATPRSAFQLGCRGGRALLALARWRVGGSDSDPHGCAPESNGVV